MLSMSPSNQVRAAYAAKYPEEYAEFDSIASGKLPSDWAAKLPKFTSEGGCCLVRRRREE